MTALKSVCRRQVARAFAVAGVVFSTASAGASEDGDTKAAQAVESDTTASAGSSDPESARKERARILYEQAAQAYARKKNFEAIELFKQASHIAHSPLYFYNLGLAYEDAGDTRNALMHYRQYLKSVPDADDRDEVEKRIEKLEQRLSELGVQQLTVSSEPTGATLFVDGEAVGVTPHTSEFSPGNHLVRLQLRGYADTNATVSLPRDRSVDLSLTLQQEPPPQPIEPPKTQQSDKDESSNHPRGLSRVRPLSWALLGVGIGSLGGSLFFELSRAKSERQAQEAETAVDAAHAQGAADAKQLSSLTLLGTGAAFTITGSVLFVLDVLDTPRSRTKASDQARRKTDVSLACGAAFCGVMGSGRF